MVYLGWDFLVPLLFISSICTIKDELAKIEAESGKMQQALTELATNLKGVVPIDPTPTTEDGAGEVDKILADHPSLKPAAKKLGRRKRK